MLAACWTRCAAISSCAPSPDAPPGCVPARCDSASSSSHTVGSGLQLCSLQWSRRRRSDARERCGCGCWTGGCRRSKREGGSGARNWSRGRSSACCNTGYSVDRGTLLSSWVNLRRCTEVRVPMLSHVHGRSSGREPSRQVARRCRPSERSVGVRHGSAILEKIVSPVTRRGSRPRLSE